MSSLGAFHPLWPSTGRTNTWSGWQQVDPISIVRYSWWRGCDLAPSHCLRRGAAANTAQSRSGNAQHPPRHPTICSPPTPRATTRVRSPTVPLQGTTGAACTGRKAKWQKKNYKLEAKLEAQAGHGAATPEAAACPWAHPTSERRVRDAARACRLCCRRACYFIAR